jgi:hypothetical protein
MVIQSFDILPRYMHYKTLPYMSFTNFLLPKETTTFPYPPDIEPGKTTKIQNATPSPHDVGMDMLL